MKLRKHRRKSRKRKSRKRKSLGKSRKRRAGRKRKTRRSRNRKTRRTRRKRRGGVNPPVKSIKELPTNGRQGYKKMQESYLRGRTT